MDAGNYLHPDFDPTSKSVKIADLTNIFIDNGVRYNGASKKADYIQLFETHIRPMLPRLRQQAERVRASSAGIEDRRGAQSQSLQHDEMPKPKKAPVSGQQRRAGLATSASSSRLSEELEDTTSSIRKLAGSRKAASMHNLAAIANSAPTASGSRGATGRRRTSVEPAPPSRRSSRRSASVEVVTATDDEHDELASMDVDEVPVAPSRPTSRKASQKATRNAPAVIDEIEDEDMLVEHMPIVASQQSRPTPVKKMALGSSPARSYPVVEIEVPRRRKSEAESPQKRKTHDTDINEVAESGFSEYNPFQSSPDREKSGKRRKSSMGVKSEGISTSSGLSHSKTMPDLGSLAQASQGTPATTARSQKSANGAAFSAGLDRYKRKISGSPDTLPPPLPRLLSPAQSGGTPKARPSFAALAIEPEDFEIKSHSSPSKAERAAAAKQLKEAKLAAAQQVALLDRDLTFPEPVEDLAVHQSEGTKPLEVGAEGKSETPGADDASSARSNNARKRNKIPTPKASPSKAVIPAVGAGGKLPTAAKYSLQATGATLALLLSSALWQGANVWADGKKALGFCDTAETTNAAVQYRDAQYFLVREQPFDAQNWQSYLTHGRNYIAPVTCTPCPEEGVCRDGRIVKCNEGYLQMPNSVAYLVAGSQDPKKSVLPLLLPPKCAPDTVYLQRVFETASTATTKLREVKGDRICSGEDKRRIKDARKHDFGDSPDAWTYGVSETDLKKTMLESLDVQSWVRFDRIFGEALSYLAKHKEIIEAEYQNERYIASTTASMPLNCRLRLAAYSSANEHKGVLAALLSFASTIFYTRSQLRKRRKLHQDVEELVPLALSLLQAQNQNHSLGDSMTPVPYLAPSQLRDLVLRDERSASRKADLWQRVEKKVEGNANVRARTAEQHGEEVRVWEWIGGAYDLDLPEDDVVSATPAAPVSRRKSYAGLAHRSSLSRAGTPRHSSERHITWDANLQSAPDATSPVGGIQGGL